MVLFIKTATTFRPITLSLGKQLG